MKIKEFYLEKYPTDVLGTELKGDINFFELYNLLVNGGDVYRFLGVSDSLVRERVFMELANLLEKEYTYVYNLWLNAQFSESLAY